MASTPLGIFSSNLKLELDANHVEVEVGAGCGATAPLHAGQLRRAGGGRSLGRFQQRLSGFRTGRSTDAVKGNNNGVLDIGDLGTQVQRTNAAQPAPPPEPVCAPTSAGISAMAGRFDIGTSYIDSKMTSRRVQTQQTLGDWGITNVGDIEEIRRRSRRAVLHGVPSSTTTTPTERGYRLPRQCRRSLRGAAPRATFRQSDRHHRQRLRSRSRRRSGPPMPSSPGRAS